MSSKQNRNRSWDIILTGSAVFACICVIALVLVIVSGNLSQQEATESPAPTEPVRFTIMDDYDKFIANEISQAQDAALSVTKVYWIDEDAEIAPTPNAEYFGQTDDPASLQNLLDDAAGLLDGQELLFSAEVALSPNSVITYYLDQSILAITWQQVIGEFTYTISEVKITHPSQFRRYLANNEFNSDYTYPPTKMAEAVQAVVASSGDYYLGKDHGIIVYQGQLRQVEHSDKMDACFIDENGDLILVEAGTFSSAEAVQEYVEQKDIDFSLAFGPILIKNGQRCEPETYLLGEVNRKYPRMALCQRDDLHYLLVAANGDFNAWTQPTIYQFAEHLDTFGCESAYALDGGRTPVITMDGQVLNPRNWNERWISDIIYFATAIESEKEANE